MKELKIEIFSGGHGILVKDLLKELGHVWKDSGGNYIPIGEDVVVFDGAFMFIQTALYESDGVAINTDQLIEMVKEKREKEKSVNAKEVGTSEPVRKLYAYRRVKHKEVIVFFDFFKVFEVKGNTEVFFDEKALSRAPEFDIEYFK